MRPIVVLFYALSCGGSQAAPDHITSAPSSTTPSTTTTATTTATPPATSPSSTNSSGILTLADARRYMVELINRDRATEHLPPVTLDEGPASTAGQAHADDMARLGYLGHWGSDGSVPEQRLTEAGGADIDFENAFCVTDEKTRPLVADARFTAADIERAESAFFNEVPPNDGHKKTILGKYRKRVGIGIAMPRAFPNEIVVPCISQEFVDTFGTYAPIPKSIKLGATLHVAGTLGPDVKIGAVGLGRIEEPKPITTSELNKRRSYQMGTPYEMYWPKGYVSKIELKVTGNAFAIDVPVSDKGQRGLYEISVWAQHPGEKDFAYVGLRTIRID